MAQPVPAVLCILLAAAAGGLALLNYQKMESATTTVAENEKIVLLNNAIGLYEEAVTECTGANGNELPELKTISGNAWDSDSPFVDDKCSSFNGKYVLPGIEQCEQRWYNISSKTCRSDCTQVRGSVYRKREPNYEGEVWFNRDDDDNVFPNTIPSHKHRTKRVDMRLPYITDPTNGLATTGAQIKFGKCYFSFDFVNPKATDNMIRASMPSEALSTECYSETDILQFAQALADETDGNGIEEDDNKPTPTDCDSPDLALGSYKVEMRCYGKEATKKFIGRTDCLTSSCASWGIQHKLWELTTVDSSGRQFWHWDDNIADSTEKVLKDVIKGYTNLINNIQTKVKAPLRKNMQMCGGAAAVLLLLGIIFLAV